MSIKSSCLTNCMSIKSSCLTNFMSTKSSCLTNCMSIKSSCLTNFMSTKSSCLTNFMSIPVAAEVQLTGVEGGRVASPRSFFCGGPPSSSSSPALRFLLVPGVFFFCCAWRGGGAGVSAGAAATRGAAVVAGMTGSLHRHALCSSGRRSWRGRHGTPRGVSSNSTSTLYRCTELADIWGGGEIWHPSPSPGGGLFGYTGLGRVTYLNCIDPTPQKRKTITQQRQNGRY